MKTSIQIHNRTITLFRDTDKPCPLIIMNQYAGVPGHDNSVVWKACQGIHTPSFTLAVLNKTDEEWNDEMTPWYAPPLFPGDTACGGKADQYLSELTCTIIPELKTLLNPTYVALAGYSLAGLFSVYAMYKTDIFDRIVSGSGSFWYPDIVTFIKTHEIKKSPQRLYFSLGDQECKDPTPLLQSVQTNTQAVHEWFANLGITTIFELNHGNHYQHIAQRMARGIQWMLED